MYNGNQMILYGAGKLGYNAYLFLKKCDVGIRLIVDSDKEKWQTKIGSMDVVSPEALKNTGRDASICITVKNKDNREEIYDILIRKYQWDKQCIIMYEQLPIYVYSWSDIIKSSVNVQMNHNTVKSAVFFLLHGFAFGGVEAWVRNLCEELVRLNHKNIAIICGEKTGEVPEPLKEYTEELSVYPVDLFEPTEVVEVIGHIVKHLPCKLIVNYPDVMVQIGGIIKNCYPDQIEIVSVIHGGTEKYYDLNYAMNCFADQFVAVSMDIMQGMINKGVGRERIFHMTCPVACDDSLSRLYNEKQGQPIRIGYAGRIVKIQKRCDLFIGLLKELERLKINYILTIAGEGSYEKELCEDIRELALNDKVKLAGKVDSEDIPAFWKEQDICISLSEYEGRSISIMEAMANGAVPVVTETSGVHEDIVDGENGFIVKIGDYESQADRIAYIAEHRELLRNMGEKSHKIIQSKSKMSEHIKFWEAMIQ